MTEPDPNKIQLTQEQRKRLGQVYRLILNWRRERKHIANELPISVVTEEENSSVQMESGSIMPAEDGA